MVILFFLHVVDCQITYYQLYIIFIIIQGIKIKRIFSGPGCTSLVHWALGCYTKVKDRCGVKGAQGTGVCALKTSSMPDIDHSQYQSTSKKTSATLKLNH